MGAILLTASHNPGGPTEDFGIKFNSANGGPAPESLTNLIYEKSKQISRYLMAEIPSINLSEIRDTEIHLKNKKIFRVSVIDSCEAYIALMQKLFDFD